MPANCFRGKTPVTPGYVNRTLNHPVEYEFQPSTFRSPRLITVTVICRSSSAYLLLERSNLIVSLMSSTGVIKYKYAEWVEETEILTVDSVKAIELQKYVIFLYYSEFNHGPS